MAIFDPARFQAIKTPTFKPERLNEKKQPPVFDPETYSEVKGPELQSQENIFTQSLIKTVNPALGQIPIEFFPQIKDEIVKKGKPVIEDIGKAVTGAVKGIPSLLMPQLTPIMPELTEEEKMATLKTGARALGVVRAPFERFIEKPVSKVVTDLQKGQFSVKTLSEAGQAFLPMKLQDPSSYEDIWGNYWKSIMGTEAPEWYKGMGAFGTAVGVEIPAIRGAKELGKIAISRKATLAETEFLKSKIRPLADKLKQSGLNSDKLPKGDISIKLDVGEEIFMSKDFVALLKGKDIRVPRFWKMPKVAAVDVVPEMGKAVVPGITIPPKITPLAKITPTVPITSEIKPKIAVEEIGKVPEVKPEIAAITPKIEVKPEPLVEEAKKYKTVDEFVESQESQFRKTLESVDKSGLEYSKKIEIEETGEMVEVSKDVSEILRENSKRESAYNQLLECLAAL